MRQTGAIAIQLEIHKTCGVLLKYAIVAWYVFHITVQYVAFVIYFYGIFFNGIYFHEAKQSKVSDVLTHCLCIKRELQLCKQAKCRRKTFLVQSLQHWNNGYFVKMQSFLFKPAILFNPFIRRKSWKPSILKLFSYIFCYLSSVISKIR